MLIGEYAYKHGSGVSKNIYYIYKKANDVLNENEDQNGVLIYISGLKPFPRFNLV